MEITALILVFLGIPTLIHLNILPVSYRLFALFGACIVIGAWGFVTLTPDTMGLLSHRFGQGLIPWTLTTLVLFAGIYSLARSLRHRHADQPLRDPHFLFLFIPISIAQQFLYQAVFLQKLLQVMTPIFAIAACALCFGFMHTIFPRPGRNFLLATIGGACFSSLYFFNPNFLFAALSHMILNFTAVYFSFFTLLTSEKKPQPTGLSLASR